MSSIASRLRDQSAALRDNADFDYDKPFKPPAGMNVARAVLTVLARTRNVAVAMTPHTAFVVTNASFGELGYNTIEDTVAAATAATQGSARKTYVVTSGTNAVASITNNGASPTDINPVFGWRVRASASFSNNNFRPVLIDVGPILNNAGIFTCPTPIFSVAAVSQKIPLDIFVLSTANAGGVATIVPGASDLVTTGATTVQPGLLVRALSSDYTVTIESFNSRELISRGNRSASLDLLLDDDSRYGNSPFVS